VQVVNKLSFCESSPTQVLVAFKSLPTIGPINSTTNSIFVDDKIVLIGNPIVSNPPLTYTWFVSDPSKATITNDKEAVLKAISKGKVDISYHVTDINGCTSLESPILPFTISQISRFVIPSAFSPNNDGLNDYLNILLYPATLEIKYFKVFNRQGALVYETNRIGQGWDGRVNGMMQESDIYFWIAEFITDDGETVKKTGQTVLVK
jgi:gliding motility-associated-like protein